MGSYQTLDNIGFAAKETIYVEKKQNVEMFVRTSVITAQPPSVKLTPITSKLTPPQSTPIKSEKQFNAEDRDYNSSDETPVKAPRIPMKRRSLMRDIRWADESMEEKSAMKHPMEMRSRKRSKLKPYYDIEEYVDYGPDLKFLFEEEDQLPDFEIRPRRRSRKRKVFTSPKQPSSPRQHEDDLLTELSIPTSKINDAKLSPTSFADENFSSKKSRPNSSLRICNLTSTTPSAGTFTNSSKLFESVAVVTKNLDVSITKRKTNFEFDNFAQKCSKQSTPVNEEHNTIRKTLGLKTLKNRDKIPKLNCDRIKEKKHLGKSSNVNDVSQNDCRIIFSPKNFEKSKNFTVTSMNLRRRHSTPSLGGIRNQEYIMNSSKKLLRTVSTPAGSKEGEDPKNKTEKKVKTREPWQDDECSSDSNSDSEQFVDSPDSGFGSESSCSSATPDSDSVSLLSFPPSKCDESSLKSDIDCDITKQRVSRTESNDSGIQSNNDTLLDHKEISKISQTGEEIGERLILCQKSIVEAQEREREEKKKQEEALLREKFQCQWVGCPNPFESRCGADLHTHLQECHAENYSCKWKGCRYFEIVSRKLSFLQRHIGEHSGEKPFKCILDGCDASFSSLCSRKRHVEAHYSEVSLPKARVGGDNGGFSRYLLNSRRVKDKRKTLANRHDCMDGRTLGFIRSALIQNEVSIETDDDVISEPRDIVFQSEIIGKRVDKNGKQLVLVRWKPDNILQDEWIPETELLKEKRMLKSDLPWNTKDSLKRLFFFGRKACTRKPSLLRSLF
uniref:zinc finger protein AEBP2-like isoform X1 n=1 Tax=Styela clava TaxID=7725 RepID=UPI00193949EA|nr:zinc finger protein AEBP2-like isoform X1 [Styela clava]